MSQHSRTIIVDCDGVLHSYTSRWQGETVLPDPPVPGAIEWLEEMTQHFEVHISSTRCATASGCVAIARYLEDNGLTTDALRHITIGPDKPPAVMIVDDRAWCFTGNNFPSVGDVLHFVPWNKTPRPESQIGGRA